MFCFGYDCQTRKQKKFLSQAEQQWPQVSPPYRVCSIKLLKYNIQVICVKSKYPNWEKWHQNISSYCIVVGAKKKKLHKLHLNIYEYKLGFINENLHHLRGAPSHSLSSRDESLSPARVSGVELLHAGGALSKDKHQKCSGFLWTSQSSSLWFQKQKKRKAVRCGIRVGAVWLTLPPSTISFCKSVDAMISMRMAWGGEGHTIKEQEHTTKKTMFIRTWNKNGCAAQYGGFSEMCKSATYYKCKDVKLLYLHQVCAAEENSVKRVKVRFNVWQLIEFTALRHSLKLSGLGEHTCTSLLPVNVL